MAAVTCYGNNLNGFNKLLSLEHSLLLFDYNSSVMKCTLYSSKQRLIIYKKPNFLFKKWNVLGAATQVGVINLL